MLINLLKQSKKILLKNYSFIVNTQNLNVKAYNNSQNQSQNIEKINKDALFKNEWIRLKQYQTQKIEKLTSDSLLIETVLSSTQETLERTIKQNIKTYKLDEVVLLLTAIGKIEGRLSQQILSKETFLQLLKKVQIFVMRYFQYYSYFLAEKRLILRPGTNISEYIIDAYAMTYQEEVQQIYRIGQKQIYHMVSYSNQNLTFSQFKHIISSKVYNVTDLPFIYRKFVEDGLASLPFPTTLQEIQQNLIYLAHFSQITLIYLEQSIKFIKQYITNKRVLTASQFLTISNILYLSLRKFTIPNDTDYVVLKKNIKEILTALLESRFIKFNSNRKKMIPNKRIQQIITNQNELQNFIQTYSNQAITAIKKHRLSLHNKSTQIQNNKNNPFAHQIMKKQRTSLKEKQMKRKFQLKAFVKIIRFIFSYSHLYLDKVDIFNNLMEMKITQHFLELNFCFGDLLKQTIYLKDCMIFNHQKRKDKHLLIEESKSFAKIMNSYQEYYNSTLSNLDSLTKKFYHEKNIPFYTGSSHEELLLEHENDIQKQIDQITEHQYQFEKTELAVLQSLSNDNRFLQSLLRSGMRRVLEDTKFVQGQLLSHNKFQWNYPYYLDLVKINNDGSMNKILYETPLLNFVDTFNAHQILPYYQKKIKPSY